MHNTTSADFTTEQGEAQLAMAKEKRERKMEDLQRRIEFETRGLQQFVSERPELWQKEEEGVPEQYMVLKDPTSAEYDRAQAKRQREEEAAMALEEEQYAQRGREQIQELERKQSLRDTMARARKILQGGKQAAAYRTELDSGDAQREAARAAKEKQEKEALEAQRAAFWHGIKNGTGAQGKGAQASTNKSSTTFQRRWTAMCMR